MKRTSTKNRKTQRRRKNNKTRGLLSTTEGANLLDISKLNTHCWGSVPNAPLSFSEFKEQYWPEFKSSSKFGLDPVLVYSEIMGVIKGSRFSEQTGSHTYLSRENYLGGLVRRVSSQLNPEMRRKIYSIFEQYRALKAARLEHDPADR